MVVLSKQSLDHISLTPNTKQSFHSSVPTIDLSRPGSKSHLVKACEEFGFFKVINHGVPLEFMNRLEDEAVKFFSLPQSDKDHAIPANPFGYGSKRIGPNGDVGMVEYLLMQTSAKSISQVSLEIFKDNPHTFCSATNNYLHSVKKLACEVLELLAEGLEIQQSNIFSRLLMEEESDAIFRINFYPPCNPELQALGSNLMTGFGEHTDPQIISVLKSNGTSGLQISLRDGSWVSVPSDQNSFFIMVGDSLQVLTNGRFRSVRHRVLTGGPKSRISMIYFGAPALEEKIAPLQVLMTEGEESLYNEFTWSEYKKSVYRTRLADNRLVLFERNRELAQ